MDNSPNTRDLWRRAWRLARDTGKHGKPLYDAIAPMGERETVCRAFIGIEAARANVKPLQLTLSEIVLNNWGTKNPFLCPSMDSPRFNGWRRIASLQQALRNRMAARGVICKDSDDNWLTGFDLAALSVKPGPTVDKPRRRSAKARAVMANAGAILRAARRLDGAYTWGPSLCLAVPRRHNLGWQAFTWHDGDKQCTVDLVRHRSIAKAAARDVIAKRAQALPLAA